MDAITMYKQILIQTVRDFTLCPNTQQTRQKLQTTLEKCWISELGVEQGSIMVVVNPPRGLSALEGVVFYTQYGKNRELRFGMGSNDFIPE